MYEYINIVSNNFFSNIKPEHFIFKYRIGYERHDIVESFFFDISNLSDKDFAKQPIWNNSLFQFEKYCQYLQKVR